MGTKNYKILIVDDDSAIIESISSILENYDYDIIAAPNGQKALKLAFQNTPDLVITDWDMPVMNGISFIQELKKEDKTKGTPVIMITGVMNTIENLKVAFDAGTTDFIQKPIVPVELVARTRSMLMLADYYKEAIKQKEWELALQAKNMYQANELNTNLMEKLEILKTSFLSDNEDAKRIIENIKTELRANTKSQAWEDFETHFMSVNPTFIDNLVARYPNLSSSEIKLCILLRLNLNSKEIAAITFQNAHSVDIARYRLRKKIGLERSDNLINILIGL